MSATDQPRRGRPRSFDRETALQRAMELFWAHGYEGVSISQLTAAMGIGAPSLYAAFGDKEQLFREAVALYDRVEGRATERALREEPTARAAVEALLRDNAALYADPDTPRGCLVVLGVTTWTPGNEPVREYLRDLRSRTEAAIRERLQRGVADGDLPRDADVTALAAYVNTVLEGLSIQARDGAPLQQMQAIVDCAIAAWDRLAGTSSSATLPG